MRSDSAKQFAKFSSIPGFSAESVRSPTRRFNVLHEDKKLSGRLMANITNVFVLGHREVIVEGRFQALNLTNVLNSSLLKVRWFVGRSSYRQTLFLNSTEITYPSNPSDMIHFRATFPNFFPESADFSGYLRVKAILTNWPLRKKALCLRWKRRA